MEKFEKAKRDVNDIIKLCKSSQVKLSKFAQFFLLSFLDIIRASFLWKDVIIVEKRCRK